MYTVVVSNVGTKTDTYTLSGAFPGGFVSSFAETSVEVPAGSFREVKLTLTPPPGTPTGGFNFTVLATSTSEVGVNDRASGSGSVVGQGVKVELMPGAAAPGTTFEMKVTNTGLNEDTFDLSLAGPGAFLAELDMQQVTLGPGQMATAQVITTNTMQIFPGGLELLAVGTSQANASVEDLATASLTIATTLRVEAEATPQTTSLPSPGSAVVLVEVQNLGNVEDAYQAAIVSTSGPLTASLRNLDGTATQLIGLFRLPGTARGLLALDTLLLAEGEGQVEVQITSLSDGAVVDTAMAIVQTQQTSENPPPVAEARAAQHAWVDTVVVLDGSPSYDPEGALITYTWQFIELPADSALTQEDLLDANTPCPRFIPDVVGQYEIELVVQDEQGASSLTRVQLEVFEANVPPNAVAGDGQTALVGDLVTVDGGASWDPDKAPQPLTFHWRFGAVPLGSSLVHTNIGGAEEPRANFVPDINGSYVLELVVSDGDKHDIDVVTILVTESNVAPNARAGEEQRRVLGDVVIVDGTQSFDPDAGPQTLRFRWQWVSLPVTSGLTAADLLDTHTAMPQFTPDVVGSYVVKVTVDDGEASDMGTVVVKVVAQDASLCEPWPAGALIGTLGNDALTGTNGDDVIVGLSGNDLIKGFGGSDLICAGAGNDSVEGGFGHDTLDGGPGNDSLKGQGGMDIIYGGSDNDRIEGGPGDDELDGGPGNDLLKGQGGADILNGGDGQRDILDGGPEYDQCLEGEVVKSCEEGESPGGQGDGNFDGREGGGLRGQTRET